MIYYIETNLIAIIIASVLLVQRRHMTSSGETSQEIMGGMLRLLIVLSISDAFAYYFLGKSYWGIEIANILYFIAMAVGAYTWFLFVYVKMNTVHNLRKTIVRTVAPVALLCIAILFNPVIHFFYTIDDALIYHRGNGVVLTWLIEWSYMIAALVINIRAVRKEERAYRKKELRGYLFFVIPLSVAAVFQMCIYGTSTTQIGFAFAILMVFINNQQHQVQRDDLTGLNNKNALLAYRDSMVNRSKAANLMLFMLDADDFKKINDNYGHLRGDQALQDIAGIMKEAASAFGGKSIMLYRYAGDEFVVVCEEFTEQDAGAFLDFLHESVELANVRNRQRGKRYTLGLSVGRASGECSSLAEFDALMKQADEQMYQEKKAKKISD